MYGHYLQTLGIPLLKGRMLDDRDRQTSKAVLINQAMADKFWPGKDPIGKRFGQGSDKTTWYEVVGVLGNVRSYGLARTTPFEFYRTIDESVVSAMTVVIRTPRRRRDGNRPDGAADHRVDRSRAADQPGPDDGACRGGVGRTAAADVGADRVVRRALPGCWRWSASTA